jgi:hypothetical protein
MPNDRNTSGLGRFFLKLSIILLTFLCLGSPSAKADNRIVTVGVYENAPKVFTSESGKPTGIFIDIIEHIAKIGNLLWHCQTGIQYIQKPFTVKGLLEKCHQVLHNE